MGLRNETPLNPPLVRGVAICVKPGLIRNEAKAEMINDV
jgi:hypothetical protein